MQEINTGIDWASPVAEDQPAGPNLEFDADFAELEAVAASSPEQQYGDTVIAGKEPEWPQVLALATALSRRTRDLRVVLLMTRALTKIHGFAGLAAGLSAVETLLIERWDQVHPQIVVDGQNDPQMRCSVLSEFGNPGGLVGDLRQCPVLKSSLGMLSVRDIERLSEQGAVDVDGVSISRSQADQMMSDLAQTDAAGSLRRPGESLQKVERILAKTTQELSGEYAPDLSSLQRALRRTAEVLEPKPFVPAGSTEGSSNTEAQRASAGGVAVNVGSLQSRADVLKTLDAVCLYLEKNEPTNPAPLLIRRAQKLMTMSFIDIVKAMTPDGLTQARFVAGLEEGDESN